MGGVTDAPDFMVELMIDEYDGWLDSETDAPTPAAARPARRAEADQEAP